MIPVSMGTKYKEETQMRLVHMTMITVLFAGCAASEFRTPSGQAPDARRIIADPAFLEQYAETRRFSAGRPASIKLMPDGSAVLFLRSGPRSFVQDLYEFDVETGEEHSLLTAEQILEGAEEHLSIDEAARRERMRISARGITSYRLSKDGSMILAPLSGRLFLIRRGDRRVTELHSDKGYPIDPRFSPDAGRIACVRDGELFVTDLASGAERQLTFDEGEHVTHGLSEFVAQEEMGRYRGYWWSPDSKTIAYQRTDTEGVELMNIMDATHPDKPPRSWPYPRPGKQNADVQLGLISADGGETVWVQWDRERYPYLAAVKWEEENTPLTILLQNRRQTEEALLRVDATTGYTTGLLIERDDAWINLDRSMPHWLPDDSAFLWTTERTGKWQLELHDRDGRLIAPIATPTFGFKRFVALDADQPLVYVAGSDDPTQTHLYKISFEGAPAEPVRLTVEPGTHFATFSKNGSTYVYTANTMDGRSTQVVRRADGTEVGELRSVAEVPPMTSNIELTTVGTDPTFHAVLVRPRNFDPSKRYPVIVNVYGGPHGQMVTASPRRYLLSQWIADHGFVVVSLDGRGTSSRGRAWERVIKNNVIDVPLADQVAGLEALGDKYPELDLSRVGIYGWSFGGYFTAMAVMRRPDVFHAGVAGAPVCDWLDYDTHYTERYMGLPDENPDGYKAASVLTYAKDLSRPLLIIHGTTDDNVYFMHSLKMSQALFRAGKEHDFLALSGFTHMVPDPLATVRLYERIVSYFQKHLADG